MKFQRLLIRGTNWIGDSVMSLPAVREVRRLHPEVRISLLVRPWVADLFEGQKVVDEIVRLEPRSGVLASSRLMRGFDAALLFPNAFRAALAAWLARVPERIGYGTDGRGLLLTRRARPRTGALGRHQIYAYLDLLFQTGLSPHSYLEERDFRPDIHLEPTVRGKNRARELLQQSGADLARPLVVFHPGAAFGAAKRWFPERYAALADLLIETEGVEIALVGSAREAGIGTWIVQHSRGPIRDLTGQTDLPALMGLLAISRLFVTNDSGPMHLGAALGVPLIALFGSTDEVATGPVGPRARVIHKHVECSPCLLRECPIDLRCFDRIRVEEVLETARLILDSP